MNGLRPMTTIAAPHCDCSDCRAAHWDDAPPATFTAHEVTDAYQEGHANGVEHTVRRLIATLTAWLTTDAATEDAPHADG
jgi:hypothetical protein